MNNKGFTLIELLATIAILMIILLIAVPRILDMMETARREAFRDTAYLITHTGKLFSAENPGDHEFYYIDSDEYNADGYFLDYSGTKPVTGIVLLNNNGKIAIALHNGTYCATKGGNETLVTITTVAPINCTVENIINTDKTWTEIATNWDIELDDLLDINDESNPNSPTEGLDIIIPVNVTGSTSSGTGDPETDSFTKTYYSMGYVTDEVSFPYSFDYTIELGVLPMDIADITSANVTSKSVFETLIDFKRYIVKRNMGEVIWPGADPVEIDIDQASIFQAHANTSDNMTVDDVTVTCDTVTCEANIEVTVNNITGIDLYNINGNDIAYTPLKFTVEFNGQEISCPSNPQPDSCFTFASGTISDYDEVTCGTDVVIPCTIGGVDVTTIGYSAFSDKGLTSLILPETLTSIGEWAFEYNYFTSVVIPNNVTTIGGGAFYYGELSSVILPSGLTTITAESFENNYITSVTIPDSVTIIGDWAFYLNPLTSITIPDSVTSIGDGAFQFAFLTSITIPSSVTTIGNYAFSDNSLTSINIPSSVTTIGEGAFAWNNLTSITIPNNVTTMNYGAFQHNQLNNITIGTGLTEIADTAFYGNLLTNVTIPNNIIAIGSLAFEDNLLTGVDIPNSLTTIGAGAFEKNQLTSINIPNSVTFIGDAAFTNNQLPNNQAFIYSRNPDGSENTTILVSYGGANRDNVTIPNGVVTIGVNALGQSDITSITFPNTLVTISDYAFSGNFLTSVTIPNSVTAIGNRVFYYNELTSVVFGTGLQNIGDYAFSSNQLTSITINNASATIGNYILYYNNNYFRTSYYAGGAGTYTGTQSGTWTKQ